jgi:tetrapyrrole methylase family protein/MazG family protein
MIYLIGLGPADAGMISMAARDALRAVDVLYFRTERHPAAEALKAEGLKFESFDSLYDRADTFDSVYETIARRMVLEGNTRNIAYAVPGHPLIAEESAKKIIQYASEAHVPFRIIGSASFLEPALEALGVSVDESFLILDALSMENMAIHSDIPLLIHQIYDRDIASRVKLALMKEYPDDWNVQVIRQAGIEAGAHVDTVPLHRSDRVDADHLTSLYVPPLPEKLRRKTFGDLVNVMARLRGEDGCPWDREQTHETLKKYMIEECYEAIDAIDADDVDELCEELGDVLLQVVFHAQLEAEAGVFTVDDVIRVVVEKLIRRHPHVFGDVEVSGSGDVLVNWEKIKRSEKGNGWRKSALDGVPSGLPALMRAMEISKRAAKVGFEWNSIEDVFGKLDEEILELRQALEMGNQSHISDEIGDILFTIVNIARWQKVDSEDALRTMVKRFITRFHSIEQSAEESGRSVNDLTLQEMDILWEKAKKSEPQRQ